MNADSISLLALSDSRIDCARAASSKTMDASLLRPTISATVEISWINPARRIRYSLLTLISVEISSTTALAEMMIRVSFRLMERLRNQVTARSRLRTDR